MKNARYYIFAYGGSLGRHHEIALVGTCNRCDNAKRLAIDTIIDKSIDKCIPIGWVVEIVTIHNLKIITKYEKTNHYEHKILFDNLI